MLGLDVERLGRQPRRSRAPAPSGSCRQAANSTPSAGQRRAGGVAPGARRAASARGRRRAWSRAARPRRAGGARAAAPWRAQRTPARVELLNAAPVAADRPAGRRAVDVWPSGRRPLHAVALAGRGAALQRVKTPRWSVVSRAQRLERARRTRDADRHLRQARAAAARGPTATSRAAVGLDRERQPEAVVGRLGLPSERAQAALEAAVAVDARPVRGGSSLQQVLRERRDARVDVGDALGDRAGTRPGAPASRRRTCRACDWIPNSVR